MDKSIKIATPMGDMSIPYNEESLLSFYKRLVKAGEGDPNLLEEGFVEFLSLSSPDDTVSDWVFWEETRSPIYIYDFMGWIEQDFILEKTLGYNMSKTKITGVQYAQMTYPHGHENMPIRATFYLTRKTDGAKFVVDLTPVEGLHIEMQISHEPSTQIRDFHSGLKEYGEQHGILKNNSVNANLEFIKLIS